MLKTYIHLEDKKKKKQQKIKAFSQLDFPEILRIDLSRSQFHRGGQIFNCCLFSQLGSNNYPSQGI